MEEAIKVVVSKKERNTTYLFIEVMMESVGSTEEEFKLNTPVPAPHIITSSSSSPPFFPQVSNTAAGEAKEMFQGKGREWRRQEKLLCLKSRETPQLYLER